MAFVDTSASRVLINQRHLSASISGWEVTSSRSMSQVTSILNAGQRFVPGIALGAIGLTGMFNPAAGDLDATIIAAAGVDNGLLWTVCPSGFTLGAPALIVRSELEDYKITSAVGSAVNVAVMGMPDDGTDIGVQLHAHGAETADLSSTSVDNAAATSNGGVATLHATAYSGLTNAVIIVEHSTNNSVWATLATFTTVTAVTSERLLVAAGTTVNRYLRSSVDVTGTGSVTYAVAFARR